jgi:hypothetical protein
VRHAFRLGFEIGVHSTLGWPNTRRQRDPKLVRLDDTEARSLDAYNAERLRQGLLPYHPDGVWASWDEYCAGASS